MKLIYIVLALCVVYQQSQAAPHSSENTSELPTTDIDETENRFLGRAVGHIIRDKLKFKANVLDYEADKIGALIGEPREEFYRTGVRPCETCQQPQVTNINVQQQTVTLPNNGVTRPQGTNISPLNGGGLSPQIGTSLTGITNAGSVNTPLRVTMRPSSTEYNGIQKFWDFFLPRVRYEQVIMVPKNCVNCRYQLVNVVPSADYSDQYFRNYYDKCNFVVLVPLNGDTSSLEYDLITINDRLNYNYDDFLRKYPTDNFSTLRTCDTCGRGV